MLCSPEHAWKSHRWWADCGVALSCSCHFRRCRACRPYELAGLQKHACCKLEPSGRCNTMWKTARLLQTGIGTYRRKCVSQATVLALSRPARPLHTCSCISKYQLAPKAPRQLSRRASWMTASGASTQHAHTNRLIDEESPYLLQHAHNPVRKCHQCIMRAALQTAMALEAPDRVAMPARHLLVTKSAREVALAIPLTPLCQHRLSGCPGARRRSRWHGSRTSRSSSLWGTASYSKPVRHGLH